MTQLRLDTPTDEQRFRDCLTELLVAAEENDITLERAWECRGADDGSWEVEIVPLTPEQPAE